MKKLWPVPDCRIEQIIPDGPAHLRIAAHSFQRARRCPDCGRASRAVHSRYERHLADLPSLGRSVSVHLWVRRFYCRNTDCARQTFVERLPKLVTPFARRTCRLAAAQGQTGLALGGEASARLLCGLSMPASADTVLRLVKATPLPDQPAPRVIGVDDWAKRKGSRYGTIIVDLERHRVVDLLPDRSAATLTVWLQQRPGIAVVARDRSTEYASGITVGAPAAVQVADRWHLLANMRQAVERWFSGAHARLRRLSGVPSTHGVLPVQRITPCLRSASDRQVSLDNRARRLELYEAVRRRHRAGEALLAIARTMQLARGTVRKYAQAAEFPERAPRPSHSIIDPHLAYLHARLAEGCEDAAVLWREIRARGFTGTARQVRRWLSEHRTKPARTAPHRWRGPMPADPTPNGDTASRLPSSRQLAWLLVQPPTELMPNDAAVVARVEQDPETAIVAKLARRFTALVRACNASNQADPQAAQAELTSWLAEARASGVPAMETFAAGLEGDSSAISAALTTPWSNGQTEGQVNRLKLIKRQMFGHASFDLLRRRVL
ncbi:MAG: ISL3 family transposase, partial [Rhodopila sp.]